VKKLIGVFLLGVVIGGLGVYGGFFYYKRKYLTPAVCYSCFWQAQTPALRKDLVEFYRQYKNPDDLVMGDVAFILWRATDQANCDAREQYREAAQAEDEPYRRFMARSIVAFSGPECGQQTGSDYADAAAQARKLGLTGEAGILDQLSQGSATPQFDDITIAGSNVVFPKGAKTMVLGDSRIEISEGTKLGAQVDRVSRDWLSYQMKWDLSSAPMPNKNIVGWHEGAFIAKIAAATPVGVYPLTGTLIAKRGDKWYAPDETGVFRFQVLEDKVEYPTTHVAGHFGIIEDTHGISALVSQSLHRGMQVVVGCGDSEGKAKAAYYLAQHGVNVIMPGDRYIDELLGYQGSGVIMGTAPVRKEGERAIVGGQPVKFSLAETIVVEDTKKNFPTQYYDAGARYFRRLSGWVPLKLDYVLVDDVNQISRVLGRADQTGATAVAVRVLTQQEHNELARWLAVSPQRRAILFHSGLYQFAQPLFEKFPQQVTFGDLHPRFE
jgi:hypothetical protein